MSDPTARLERLEGRLKRAERLARWQGAALVAMAIAVAWNAAPPASAQAGVAHRVAALEAAVTALQATLAEAGTSLAAERAAREAADAALAAAQGALDARTDAIETVIAPLSLSGTDLFITGVNVHIVNGLGSTDTTNGLGNLMVGYNEPRLFGETVRTGSHNMIIGSDHNYSGYSGLASGWLHTLSGNYAAALGFRNGAWGDGATVTGGNDNSAVGNLSTVAGGIRNHAEGLGAAVIGGDSNFARGAQSTITGGASNLNLGLHSVIGGGRALLLEVDGGWSAGGSYTVPTRGPGVFRVP